MSTHIADYCVAREDVTVWCHRCYRASAIAIAIGNLAASCHLFTDKIEDAEEELWADGGAPAGEVGKFVLFAVPRDKYPEAHGICLN